MNLLEVEGKALLAAHGLPVPKGALWPDLPSVKGELVVKAQVPAGKRGKAGGVRFVNSAEEARETAEALLGETVNGHRVDAVYLEERLAIRRELYLAVAVDRDARAHVLIASPKGGVGIEEIDDADMLRLPIDPLLGFRLFHGAQVARFLADDRALQKPLAQAAEALYRVALAEDAELVEVNPLAVVGDRVVAADAKLVLDDNARFRHPAWPAADRNEERSALEARIAEAGAVGVEVDRDGDVVAVVSGAGLMMATLDLLKEAGLKVRAVVDLGGTVLSGGDGLRQVLLAIAPVRPRTIFVNAFLQTAFCDVFAESLAEACQTAGPVVVRLKGRRAEAGRERLQSLGIEVHEDFRSAIEALTGMGKG